MSSPYLMNKIARHGEAIRRLKEELHERKGEFGGYEQHYALAFDAADFVWGFLATEGHERVLRERWVRNKVAESIIDILQDATDAGYFAPPADGEE